ncbi:MAG: hypothetical protein J6I53_02730 [Treponema sp.]|nr:hypothetical protein [Treponema sp.]
MMIDKRLVNFVPEAKKFVFLTVALRFLSLVSNTTFIFATAFILRAVKKGESFLIPFFLIALCLLASLFVNLLSSYTSFRSSSKVKITLRSRIYEKLLRLGSDYLENSATAKVIQTATDGVEQIETWFSAFLPQFYYSMIAALFTFTVISLLNLRMALVLLACVPLIPLSMAVVQGIAKKILGKYWAQYANLADNFLENLQGLTTLQIYQADGFKAKQMAKEAETFRRVTMKVLSMQLNSIIMSPLKIARLTLKGEVLQPLWVKAAAENLPLPKSFRESTDPTVAPLKFRELRQKKSPEKVCIPS